MNFLKNVLATILGFFIALVIFSIFFLMIMSVFVSSLSKNTSDKVAIKNNSVLEIAFRSPVKDYGKRVYFEDFDHLFEEYNGLNSIIKAIEQAKTDDRIKGISIKSTGNIQGLATASQIRWALQDFKESGKFVYAFNDAIAQSDYYVQSVADSIYLSPLGELIFKGLSSEILFFKDFQDKTGVTMEVIRHGKYKSAVEPFLDNKISDENRLQMKELLDSMWQIMIEAISDSRDISEEKLNQIANDLEARTPQKAFQNRLIDRIIYQDEFDEILCQAVSVPSIDKVNFVNIEEYAESIANQYNTSKSKDKIAVIYAEGDIIYGKGNVDYVGNETIAEALRKASDDDNVKAIVLRVNSPGGSALASELIHREVELAKKRKNVYVSMGNYAASGGYYIACNADRIFAEAGTITGSIGVFGMLPNVSKLAQKWGINAEQVSTHDNASGYSLFEKPSENFIKVTTESVEHIYDVFLERVATGRKMSVSQVNEIAQGRVWSGRDALKNGLIDEIGNLNDVIAYAASENGLANYSVKSYPTFRTSFRELFDDYSMSLKESALQEELGADMYKIYKRVRSLSQQKGVQAQMNHVINLD